jgi:hypothetical protein
MIKVHIFLIFYFSKDLIHRKLSTIENSLKIVFKSYGIACNECTLEWVRNNFQMIGNSINDELFYNQFFILIDNTFKF